MMSKTCFCTSSLEDTTKVDRPYLVEVLKVTKCTFSVSNVYYRSFSPVLTASVSRSYEALGG